MDTTTEIKFVIKTVPAVDQALADALGRPARAHTIYEVYKASYVTPDPTGFLSHRGQIKQWVRMSQLRIA